LSSARIRPPSSASPRFSSRAKRIALGDETDSSVRLVCFHRRLSRTHFLPDRAAHPRIAALRSGAFVAPSIGGGADVQVEDLDISPSKIAETAQRIVDRATE